MKRSEMVKLLKNTIKYTQEDHLAQRILEVIEQAGMLPPLPKNVRSIETIYGESEAGREIVGKYLLDRSNGLDIHLWDSVREKRKVNPFKWEPEE